jgi:hypothetical protein
MAAKVIGICYYMVDTSAINMLCALLAAGQYAIAVKFKV